MNTPTPIFSEATTAASSGPRFTGEELAAIKDLEVALKGSDKAEIDAKVAALSTAAQKLGEKMYADMQAQQAAAGAAEGGAANGAGASEAKQKEDDVVDADFKEVKDK